MKEEYKKLLRKFRQNKDLGFGFPTLKSAVFEIEGKKLHTYCCTQYIADHHCFLIESNIQCYENRYYFDTWTDTKNSFTNDHLVLYICKIQNSALWPMLPHDDDHDENVLKARLLSLKKVFRHFLAWTYSKTCERRMSLTITSIL